MKMTSKYFIRLFKSGQKFDITLTVKNASTSGEALLKSQQQLYIDDQPVSYKRVALAPGESKKLSWISIELSKPGIHIIKIGDMAPVNVSVK